MQIIIHDSLTKNMVEITDIVTNISVETQLEDQPGKLTFDLTNVDFYINNGSAVTMYLDDLEKPFFYGYVFKRNEKNTDTAPYIAYDALRYLKNKDTMVVENVTSHQLFENICTHVGVNSRIKTVSSYKVKSKIQNNKSYYEIIKDALDETLIYTGKWYIIKAEASTLIHASIDSLRTYVYITDDSRLISYDYECSIDSDTYNRVKLSKENQDTGKRDTYIVQSTQLQGVWGLLQYYETIQGDMSPAQIQERAEQIFKIKNRELKKLKITCLGDATIQAGNSVILNIEKLIDKLPMNTYYIVKTCKHTFTDGHKMELELVVA